MRTTVIYLVVMPIVVAMAARLGVAALHDVNTYGLTIREREQRLNEWLAIGASTVFGATIILGLIVYFVVPE